MLGEMGAKQFQEWRAFEELEPFEDRRQDWRVAAVVAKLANLHRNVETHPEPYDVEDFILRWDREPEPPKTEEQKKAEMLEEAKMLRAKMKEYFRPDPPRPKPKSSIYPKRKAKRGDNG